MFTQGVPVHMDMQAEGPGVMAVIVHLPEGGHRFGLGDLGAVFFQRAGIGHQL